jgi:hypothetical protein
VSCESPAEFIYIYFWPEQILTQCSGEWADFCGGKEKEGEEKLDSLGSG